MTQPLSLSRIVADFCKSFVDPSFGGKPAPKTSPVKPLREQVIEVWRTLQKEGLRVYIGKRPLETLQLTAIAGGALGPYLGSGVVIAATVAKVATSCASQIIVCHQATRAASQSSLAVRIAVYAGAFFCVAYMPGAAAAEWGQRWDSLADMQAYYSGGPCSPEIREHIQSPALCVQEHHGSFKSCTVDKTVFQDAVVTVFTRHISPNPQLDPVSSVWSRGNETCFLSAIDKSSDVTRTCFHDPADWNNRTLTILPSTSMGRVHEGLDPGDTVAALEVQALTGQACFYRMSIEPHPIEDPDKCLFTSLSPGGPTTQLCFSSKNPADHSLRVVPGMRLNQPGQTGPVSIVIDDPEAAGFNTAPTIKAPCKNEAQRLSLWGAFRLWWSGKSPCSKKDEL
jgi:hypothetical protein